MKLVVLATLIATAAAADVCLPSKWTFKRSGQFAGFNSSVTGFDTVQEAYDLDNSQMRFTSFEDVSGTRYFRDILILAKQGTQYEVYGKAGSGSMTCTKRTGHFPIPQPCLLQNATAGGVYTVAGDVFVQLYAVSFFDGMGMQYDEIGLTVSDNIPVHRRTFIDGKTKFTALDLYFDYSINLPQNAFQIPPICQQAESGTELSEDEVAKRMRASVFRQ